MSNLKALIFDVDGTLSETEEAHRRAFNEASKDAGLPWEWSQDDYRILLKTTGGKERMRAHQAATQVLLSDDEISALRIKKTARYGDILSSGGVGLRPGVADLIEHARDASLRIAVATTTNRPNVDALTQCCWAKRPMKFLTWLLRATKLPLKSRRRTCFNWHLTGLIYPLAKRLDLRTA